MNGIVLAAISGSSLVGLVIWIIVIALVFWLLLWLINYVKVPEPFNKVLRVILAIVAVVLLINALLALVDKPFIRW